MEINTTEWRRTLIELIGSVLKDWVFLGLSGVSAVPTVIDAICQRSGVVSHRVMLAGVTFSLFVSFLRVFHKVRLSRDSVRRVDRDAYTRLRRCANRIEEYLDASTFVWEPSEASHCMDSILASVASDFGIDSTFFIDLDETMKRFSEDLRQSGGNRKFPLRFHQIIISELQKLQDAPPKA